MKETLRTTLDERGVSPVIGVILMVAITVILAAVIGSFVLGIGSNVEQTPQASLSISGDTIAHQGGDTLVSGDIKVTEDGSNITGDVVDGDLSPGGEWDNTSTFSGTIRVVHTPTGGLIAEADV